MTHGIIRNTLLQLNKVMRNKQLTLRRLSKLEGQLKQLDFDIFRSRDTTQVKNTQKEMMETIQDLIDIVNREN